MINYTLLKPVKFGSETITEFNVREEVFAKDWRGIPIQNQINHEHAMILIANLAGQPMQVVDLLSFPDLQALESMVIDFLQLTSPTSQKSSSSSPESSQDSHTQT